MEPTPQRRIRDLLAPYRTGAIAAAASVSVNTANGWQTGRGFPDVTALPALAAFLNVELGELALIVATEKREAFR